MSYKQRRTRTTLVIVALASVIIPKLVMANFVGLRAKAIYAYDLNTKRILYEENSEAQLPIGSIAKIATALVALENLDTSKKITIQKEVLTTEGDSGLKEGEEWNLRDLVTFMLLVSSNDASTALEIELGGRVETLLKLNKTARLLGLSQTYFLNSSGLDISDRLAGVYSSAKDASILLAVFYKKYPEILKQTTLLNKEFRSNKYTHIADNTNRYVAEMTGLLGSKTGSTDLAGANLTIIFDSEIDRPVAFAILGSDPVNRFQEAMAIIERTLSELIGNEI